MNTSIKLAGLALVFAFAASAHAATFAEVDSDGDGAVSPGEFVAAYPDLSADDWNAVDTDADGMLTEQEHQAGLDDGILPSA